MQQFDMYINGKPVQSGATFDVINPATGKAFAQCQLGDESHVEQAVAAAKAAFPAWSRTSDEERRQLLHALAGAMEANMPELMQLVTKETGKPLGGLDRIGSGMEVGGAIAWTQYTAELQLPVDVIQDNAVARIEVHRKPLGVVASITPWNWPLMIAIWHVMPALRAGNTVVMKPASFTPVSTLRFVQLASEILPPGVINIITGPGRVGGLITAHPDIAKVVFTGSTPTGKRIMESASGNLTRCTLELGGNDAGIVLPDVDIKGMAPKLFTACFHNNGQTCAALKRLYVHESQYEEMCLALAELANNVVVGDGLEEGTQLGPIQNLAQLEIVKELAESARADGGRFIAGGKQLDREGYFFEPTIVADLTDGCRLVDEEPFGPIVPIIKYSDIDEVIERANRNECGLGGSIWSSDLKKAAELAQRLECGSAWVNEHGALQPNAPFGGVKQSGMGVEFGLYGLAEFTSIQTLKVLK
jgi:acyl-CoA reductase-like NAD-dependent aldehyde dehydrogenase